MTVNESSGKAGQQAGAPEACGLPAGIGNPARRALAANGYVKLEQLTEVSEEELM